MYKLGVVSDSHGAVHRLRSAAAFLEQADEIVHLGDVVEDAQRLARLLNRPVRAVRGNCDLCSGEPEELTLMREGVRILLCHGHRYRVKEGLTPLALRARELGAGLALYGHTHMSAADHDGRRLLVNPGALQLGHLAFIEFRPNGPVPVMKIL